MVVRTSVGAHYGLSGWLAQRITAAVMALATLVIVCGIWTAPPLTDKHWYPFYEKMVELDVPAMIHVSASCNPNTPCPKRTSSIT